MKLRYPIQPYHLVSYSPWPMGASIAGLILTLGVVLKMNEYGKAILIMGIILVIVSLILWWKDVIIEGALMGYHTSYVNLSITIGFILFVISEVLLFFTLFWTYFHSSISPSIILGNVWPPIGISGIDPYELPLTNTIILLTSGGTLTISHNYYLSSSRKRKDEYIKIVIYLAITVILAIVFIIFQGIEYYYSKFTITDSVYGSIFYCTTAFHGLHVLIGMLYLAVNLIRMINYTTTPSNTSAGFEYSIIYYHYVDIVWLMVYIGFYVWGK